MKVWIDIGAWKGTATQFFLDNHPNSSNYFCILIEPDPNICKEYLIGRFPRDRVVVINSAAWIVNASLDFYEGKHGRGSSIFGDKKTGKLSKNPILVPCLDISRLIRIFNVWDEIIVKMNIEGAEYQIIPYLIENGVIECINKLYVAWHWMKIGVQKSEHDNLVLQTASRTNLHNWHLKENELGIATIADNQWFKDTI